jgi:hypothetical protein
MTTAEITEMIEEKKQNIVKVMNQFQSPKSIWYLFDVAEILLDMEKEKKN